MNSEKRRESTAGRMKWVISTAGRQPGPITATALNWPTSPLVPIPAPLELFSRWNRQVLTGPVIALARVGGIQIFQFFHMFGI